MSIMSPYAGIPQAEWPKVTEDLIRKHPLDAQTVVRVVQDVSIR